MVEALRDEDQDVRLNAVESIRKMASASSTLAAEAMPHVVKTLWDADKDVWRRAL